MRSPHEWAQEFWAVVAANWSSGELERLDVEFTVFWLRRRRVSG